ncbi:type IV secretory system conjugative DNA transfer family protein [Patescibacteria group bacterium]
MTDILVIALILIGIYVAAILLELLSQKLAKQRQYAKKFKVLEVRVSKENETGPIVAEQIFSSMHGIYHKLGFWRTLLGGSQDKISFEVANGGSHIKFYIAFPAKYKNFIEGQIYAQYPDVEIHEVEDYSKIQPTEIAQNEPVATEEGLVPLQNLDEIIKKSKDFKNVDFYQNIYGTELAFTDPDVYPTKRYVQFEDKITRTAVDPIAGITATLAKLNDVDEQAWIQVVVRPLDDKWRILFTKCVKIISKGVGGNIEKFQKAYTRMFCTRNRMYRIIFFPLYFFFWVQGLKAGSKISFSAGDSHKSDDDIEDLTSKSHERESSTGAAMDKVVKLLYEGSIRILYLQKKKNPQSAKIKLREIAGSFKQFNIPQINGFKIGQYYKGKEALDRFNARYMENPFILNVEELATIYHLPNMSVATPNIYWVRSRKLEPPVDIPEAKGELADELTMIGKTNFRGIQKTFGIKGLDRRRHVYIIGKTGMGKTTLLENMIFSDIQAGKGVAVIDPHGDLAESVLEFVPANRTNDVILFDPSDRDFPIAFNMLETKDPSLNTIISSGLVGIFKKIYADSWGPRLEHILRNTILTLLHYPNTTMLGITRILQDKDYRRKVVRKLEDPVLRAFWEKEFEPMQDRMKIEAISPIMNKVGQFLSSPIVRNIVGQPKSTVNLRFAMDKKKIIIVNLSKGKLGEDNSSLLGAMLITKFQIDAMSRADIPEKDRTDFYLYVDEFQNFATEAFATILSEARKYKLNLTMANQYIAQMPDEVRDAVFGNVGTILSMQIGFDDAEYMSQQYGEEVLPADLVSLSKYTAYTRLLIDGMPSKTFSLDTLPPPELEVEEGRSDRIRKVVRERYTKSREMVEDKIKRWSSVEEKKELPEGGKNLPPKGDKPKWKPKK